MVLLGPVLLIAMLFQPSDLGGAHPDTLTLTKLLAYITERVSKNW